MLFSSVASVDRLIDYQTEKYRGSNALGLRAGVSVVVFAKFA